MFQRQTKIYPGWDHIHDPTNVRPDGGINCDEAHHALVTELPDGRRVALVLSLSTGRYPATVPERATRPIRPDYYPNAHDLSLHVQVVNGRSCDWVGACDNCGIFSTSLGASDLWQAVALTDRNVDVPGESFWKALEVHLVRLVGDPYHFKQVDEPLALTALRDDLALAYERRAALEKQIETFDAKLQVEAKTFRESRKS